MKKSLYLIVLIISALVLGGLIGMAAEGASYFNWLSYALSFAFEPGTFLDTDVLRLTIGFAMKINVAQVLLVLIAIVVYYNTASKLESK